MLSSALPLASRPERTTPATTPGSPLASGWCLTGESAQCPAAWDDAVALAGDNQQAQADAAPTLVPHAERLLYPHATEPPRIVSEGEVIAHDLTTH